MRITLNAEGGQAAVVRREELNRETLLLIERVLHAGMTAELLEMLETVCADAGPQAAAAMQNVRAVFAATAGLCE